MKDRIRWVLSTPVLFAAGCTVIAAGLTLGISTLILERIWE